MISSASQITSGVASNLRVRAADCTSRISYGSFCRCCARAASGHAAAAPPRPSRVIHCRIKLVHRRDDLRLDEEFGLSFELGPTNIFDLVIQNGRVAKHRSAEPAQQGGVRLPELHDVFWSK